MRIKTYSSNIRRKEMDAVLTCMIDEKTGPGDICIKLVNQIKDNLKANGALALRSPSLALKYALRALDLDKNSGVMVSALAPNWQYITIGDLGFKPIVLDVSPVTGLVLSETVTEGIKKGGRVLILHETVGMVPNFQSILDLGIPVIEDISQSVGATVNEKPVGSFGIFSILGLEQEDILTAGGGAILIAPLQRDWIVLKQLIEGISSTELLPDINAALGLVQLKENLRNEQIRKQIYEMYIRSLLQGRHKTFTQQGEYIVPVTYSFPVILSSGLKDVQQYTDKKEIEITPSFRDSIITKRSGLNVADSSINDCENAASLAMRCVDFPLYPRLGSVQATKIAKVLATLP